MWRFFLKYSVTLHHNALVLEEWTKKWMAISSSKLQNEQRKVLCLRNKNVLRGLCTGYCVKVYIENIAT